MDFVHLHTYSQNSFYESTIGWGLHHVCKKNKFRSIALTDYEHLYGIVDFNNTCKRNHIKPILGQVFNIRSLISENNPERLFRILLLASTDEGYQNLVKLSSLSWKLDRKIPYIELKHISLYNKGLICLTSGLESEISNYILQKNMKEAEKGAWMLKDIFPRDHIYLELQDHGLAMEHEMNRGLLSLSVQLDIPLVATNMCRYPYKEDYEKFIILQKLRNPGINTYNLPNEYYVKSSNEMKYLFKDIPDAISNTLKISSMIDFNLDGFYSDVLRSAESIPVLKEKKIDINEDDKWGLYFREQVFIEQELNKRVMEGARQRYGNDISDEIIFLIEKELSLYNSDVVRKDILLLHEIIQKYKDNHYIPGPGRGACPSSIIFYCLGLTDVDPVAHGLIIERFININNLKDFDTIFLNISTRGCKYFYEYAYEKYGEDFICSIPSLTDMKDQKNIIDVLLWDLKFIPHSLTALPRGFYFYHNVSFPTFESKIWNWRICQFNPGSVSGFNNLLMDFEYLNELSVIETTILYINEKSPGFTVSHITMEDEKTIQVFRTGNTTDIFQFDDPAAMDFLQRLSPENFNDLHALVSLNRPGPISQGWLEKFIHHRHNPESIIYPHDSLKEFLENTRGMLIYQEQFMHIAHEICGLSLTEADRFRKAGGKKISAITDYFVKICMHHMISMGYSRDDADKIIQWMIYSAEYHFQKAHAVGYTMISWWMAYLKAHYPNEFLKAKEMCR